MMNMFGLLEVNVKRQGCKIVYMVWGYALVGCCESALVSATKCRGEHLWS